jgi:hypothetical protein
LNWESFWGRLVSSLFFFSKPGQVDIVLFVLRVLIAIALYAFLGVVLMVLVREQRPAGLQPSVAAALVRMGADGVPIQGSAANYPLAPHSPTWIGRDPNCAIRVNNEFVSLRHARVEWREDKQAWWIEDNDSRNGTILNDERIMRGELQDGDVVIIGGVAFRFTNQ